MSTAPAPEETAAPQPNRVKKRVYIPLILLLLLVAVAIGFYVRGTWTDTEEKNPAGPEAGTLTQLLKKSDGNVVVRCAIIVDASPKDTWAVISDYDSHHKFLPYITKLEATKKDDGKIQIDGVAASRVWGEWPFESLVMHEEKDAEGTYTAIWNEENIGEFKYNRGGWRLTPVDRSQKQTVLEFHIQVELKRHPDFMVRNVIMDRLHKILEAMRDETIKRKQA
jgi:ribosome-associated toxin RatA of RatAB toxin-antitoxin module